MRWESGQAALEAALVMPLMVFLCLGIIQLTLVQQARILTELAAYGAARAGVVWNGNNERMRDAAIVALLPTRERLVFPGGVEGGLRPLGAAYERFMRTDAALARLDWGDAPIERNGVPLRGLVRVDAVEPSRGSQQTFDFTGAEWEELEFDGPGWGERSARLLSVRLRYLYELRIPFANFVIFTAWYAAHAGIRLSGPMASSRLGSLGSASPGEVRSHSRGHSSMSADELGRLWQLAMGGSPALEGGHARRYFLPLTASCTMRMQSNFHQKWRMHR